jgi:hypothetical protein
MSKTEDHRTYSHIPRRQFISTAVLGTSALVQGAHGNSLNPSNSPSLPMRERDRMQANFEQVSTETILLPTPSDALIDLLVDISRTNTTILQGYYVIIAQLARQTSNKYVELRGAVAELQNLVPQLKVNADVSSIRDFTDIAIAGVRYVGTSAVANTPPSGSQTKLLAITSNNLGRLAESLNQQQETLTLSSAATEKLREIVRRILELNKPNENMKAASDALGSAFTKLNPEIQQVQSHVVTALKTLADAEAKEFAHFTASQPSDSDLKVMGDLRRQATKEIRTAATKMRSIQKYEPPLELQQLVKTDTTNLPMNLSQSSRALPVDMVGDLLDGCASWIAKRYSLSQRRHFESDKDVRFVNASYVQIESWTRLWGKISEVLKNVLPQASTPRVRRIYWRKWCMSIYDAQKQEAILYNILPDLPPVGEANLYDNDVKRREAAQKLSVL